MGWCRDNKNGCDDDVMAVAEGGMCSHSVEAKQILDDNQGKTSERTSVTIVSWPGARVRLHIPSMTAPHPNSMWFFTN